MSEAPARRVSFWRADTLRRAAIIVLGLGSALVVGPLGLTGDYASFLLAAVAFNAIAVLTLTMLAGLSGIWSLGHTAFIALGAYLTVNLPRYGLPLEAIIVVAMVVSAAIGYVLGLTAGRFSILYFGLLTLALALTGVEIIGHWSSATGGDQGIAVPPVKVFLTGRTAGIGEGPVVSIVLATIAFLVGDILGRGTVGRQWLAVKSQRIASITLGLVPPRENAFAFALSAALASMAGVSIAVAVGYLDPQGFSLNIGVMYIVGTVVGGTGSFLGALFGAAFIVIVPELARGVREISSYVFGASCVVVLLFLRRGVVPSLMALLLQRRSPAISSEQSIEVHDSRGADINPRILALVRDLLPPAAKPLVIENLSVSFGGLKALAGVSLTVAPGQTIGLIGPNGAGKTTLLNVLSGYVKPRSFDELRLGEVDLANIPPPRRIASGFGRTFQHAELFEELTIRESIMIAAGLAESRRRQAGVPVVAAAEVTERIIDGLGIKAVADAYPKALPFGIQKVADIGRVLAAGPSLIAFDEPFSGLDHSEAGELHGILRAMKQAGVSILIIDHSVHEVLAVADQVVVLDFGQVLAVGSPAEIESNSDVRRAYFGVAEFDPQAEAQNA